MEKLPKLSIGIPVFNGANYLPELLVNLQHQTFGDYEIIVCDNASTDATQQLCVDFAAKDRRIRYYRNERNLGANPNYNKTFALARAALFKWAAHDDLYHGTFLERCVATLDADPSAVLAHSDFACIDDAGRPFAAGHAPFTFVDPRSGQLFKGDPLWLAEGGSTLQRFWEVLFQMKCNMEIFGVIRRPALARTGLMREFYGTDKTVLAELALLGSFRHAREQLYYKRFHNDTSWNLSIRERRAWASSSAGRYSLRLRQLAAFGSAPFAKGLSHWQIAACLSLVSLLGLKVAIRFVRGRERKRRLQVAPWRRTATQLDPLQRNPPA